MAKENYLLLHQSGVLAHTDTLKSDLPLSRLAAIINLDTLEVCIDGKWENIPSGFESLEIADAAWEEYVEEEEEEEEIEEEEDLDPKYAKAVADRFYEEMVKNGTTTASVYSTIHETATRIAFESAEKKGLRAFIGKTMMDQNSPKELLEKTEESFEKSAKLFDDWEGCDDGRLRYIFTPRFAITCSKELMSMTGMFAEQYDAFIQTHLSENKEEIESTRRLFPKAKNYTDVYKRTGMIGKRTIMAHCIHLSDSEIKMLSDSGTKVAHCPYSNRFLNSGVMPYYKLKKKGLDLEI